MAKQINTPIPRPQQPSPNQNPVRRPFSNNPDTRAASPNPPPVPPRRKP